eukprot:scaffold143657_cov33-Prasinocladus_malaysianus.AAC.2
MSVVHEFVVDNMSICYTLICAPARENCDTYGDSFVDEVSPEDVRALLRRVGQFQPFADARNFARNLGLQNEREYMVAEIDLFLASLLSSEVGSEGCGIRQAGHHAP